MEHDALLSSARRLGIAAGVLLTVAMALVFYRQLMEFRDPFATWTEDADLLLRQTDWGALWIRGATGAIALTAFFGMASGGRDSGPVRKGSWVAAALATAAMCSFPAFSGHAAGTEELRWLSLPADVLHVLAAGSWVGTLMLVLYSERRWRASGAGASNGASLLPDVVPLFSPIAIVSVGLLAITGAIGSFLHIASVGALVSTSYGRLLLAKLALVGVVLGLGALNWKRLTPRLHEASGPDELRRVATIELLIAHAVILVTALLVRTSPLHDWSWSNIGH